MSFRRLIFPRVIVWHSGGTALGVLPEDVRETGKWSNVRLGSTLRYPFAKTY